MNFHVKKITILMGVILATAGCEKMNDKHKPWLENGEIDYIGKVDSIRTFAGNERIMFQYWISDPRAKSLHLTWSLGKESLETPVAAHFPTDTLELYIGGNETSIAEGTHTFNWITRDDHGNKSIIFESIANVYGPRYQSKLSNRPVVSAKIDGNDVTVTWGGKLSDDEVGINLNYTTTSDISVTRRYTADEATETVVTDVELTKPVTYRTLYLPEPTAIDTFWVASQKIDMQTITNVVLNKPVTHSSANSVNQGGNMAVDGNRTAASRWVSDATNNAQWIEVDLQGSFNINGFQMWRDQSNANEQTPMFSLQAWLDGAWVNVLSENNNVMAVYYRDFETVTTDKVRLYIPAYTNNRTRINEIEVYRIIRY